MAGFRKDFKSYKTNLIKGEKMKQNKHYKIEIETPIEHKQLNQNGYAIHYYISGNKNNDLIIFLHPAFGDHRCFDKQIDFFSKSYRVITIDMLGHGLSQVNKSKDKIDFSIKHIKTIKQTQHSTHLFLTKKIRFLIMIGLLFIQKLLLVIRYKQKMLFDGYFTTLALITIEYSMGRMSFL